MVKPPKDMAASVKALNSTFKRRQTEIPSARPAGLSPKFTQEPIRQTQWAAYSAHTELAEMALEDISDAIWAHLEPVCNTANQT